MSREFSYEEVTEMLRLIRLAESRLELLPMSLIQDTLSYWYSINIDGVSASMADTGGEVDHHLMRAFSTVYRYGKTSYLEEQRDA
jgi:hypothetical protein